MAWAWKRPTSRPFERGVVITTAPVLFDDVADLAVALALSCCRQIPKAHRFVREGKWGPTRLTPGRKLTGMRVGIVGLGRIAIELARRLEGFKTTIGYFDPAPRDVPYRRYPDALHARREQRHPVSVRGRRTSGSPPIIGCEILEALGPRGMFVNISRGWLVNKRLSTPCVAKRLGAAGLGVFLDEPGAPVALRELDNVVLTPHIASATEETMRAMGICVVDNLVSWFSGQGALTPVK